MMVPVASWALPPEDVVGASSAEIGMIFPREQLFMNIRPAPFGSSISLVKEKSIERREMDDAP